MESLCSILQARPLLLIYLNDYTRENHASPAAYIFLLKLFSALEYPMLTFHYFHPFYPSVSDEGSPRQRRDSLRVFRVFVSFNWHQPTGKKLAR